MWQALIPMIAGAAMGAGGSMMSGERKGKNVLGAALQGGAGGMGGMGMGGGGGGMQSSLANMFLQNLLSGQGTNQRGGFIPPSIGNVPYEYETR